MNIKKKKEQSRLLRICIVLAFSLLMCMNIYTPISVKADEKIPADYTPIYNISDLMGINSNPSGNYILMNDIDMTETKEGGIYDSGIGWMPLDPFYGVFDGNGYHIIGMDIHVDDEDEGFENIGLFAQNIGTIKNLGIINCKIVSSKRHANIGAIAGYGSGDFIQCFATGTIIANGTYLCIGGICGEQGLCTDCYSELDITTNTLSSVECGGIGGMNTSCSNCYSSSLIRVNGKDGGEISYRCIGGIVGLYNWGSIENCYYRSDFLKTTLKDIDIVESGKPLTDAQMRLKGAFAGFDFKNVWEIDPYSSYKYPQLRNNRQQRVTDLKLMTPITKTVYKQGESLDVSGGTLGLVYEGGYTATISITQDMVSGYKPNAIGKQELTISYGGKKFTLPVEVRGIEASEVVIYAKTNKIEKGQSIQLTATIIPANASDTSIKWESSGKGLQIDSTGKITGIEVGEYIVTATASNGVKGQYGIKVISPAVSLTLNKQNATIYLGESIQLSATVSPQDSTDNVEWGSSNGQIATVSEKGEVTGHKTGTVTITAKAGSSAKASCTVKVKGKLDSFKISGVSNKEYTGKWIGQNLQVTDGSVALVQDVDYQVSYSNNIQPGIATITVKGIGFYEGELSSSFEIRRKITDFRILGVSDKKYTGKAIEQTLQVTDGNMVLAQGTDYQVSYSNNVQIGTATITVKGIGYYEGELSSNFKIKGSLADFEIKGVSDKKYTGKAIEQTLQVTNGNIVLVQGTDYEVSYSNNIEVGTATITVKGIGYYDGKISHSFKILPNITVRQGKIQSLKNQKTRKLVVSCKKINEASGYQVRYSLKSSMKPSKSKQSKKNSFTLSKLKRKKYYVQVRAYTKDSNGTRYSKWSAKKSIKIKK